MVYVEYHIPEFQCLDHFPIADGQTPYSKYSTMKSIWRTTQRDGQTSDSLPFFVQIEFKEVSSRIPSRELTYPTLGKGKSSSNMPWVGIC